jgi:hypothetical protein
MTPFPIRCKHNCCVERKFAAPFFVALESKVKNTINFLPDTVCKKNKKMCENYVSMMQIPANLCTLHFFEIQIFYFAKKSPGRSFSFD